MPYKIMQDGDEWCVHKESGEKVGCHDSEDKAKRQVAALYASEGKSLSDIKLDMHRKFNALLDELDNYELVAGDGEPEPVEPAPEPEKTITDTHDHAEPHTLYAAPTSNNPGLLKSLAAKFQSGLKPGQTAFKAADGRRYMLITTSNSYPDREDETIKSDALKADIDRHWTGEDADFMSNNPLLFWHDDDVRLGDIVWGDLIGPFYVELAREADNVMAKRYFDWRESHPDEKWGASHRFAYFTHERQNNGDYDRIFKQETTSLPLEAAANLGTLSGVLPMSDKRAKKFDEIMGLDGAYDTLKTEGYDALVTKLQAQGVEHKSTDKPDTAQAGADMAAQSFAKMIIDMAEDMADLDHRVAQAETGLTDQRKSYEDKEGKLDETQQRFDDAIKAVTDLAEKLQERLEARPTRASRSKDTEIEEGELSEEVQQMLTVEHPTFGKVNPKPGVNNS